MRLLLVRHGQTDFNAEYRYLGALDSELNAHGLVAKLARAVGYAGFEDFFDWQLANGAVYRLPWLEQECGLAAPKQSAFERAIATPLARRVSQMEDTMGLLTFSINLTLDGCVDHREGIADDETHAFFTRLMDESGAMLWGRITYEMMESYWPAVARGDAQAPPAMRAWAVKLEAKAKYVVSRARKDFPWTNSHHIAGDLRTGVQQLKDATPDGVLLGSGQLAAALDRLDLIDEYQLLVHPRIAGHGPTLFNGGLPRTRRLELVSATPLRNGAVAMHYRRAR